ncbi:MAG: hydantoinase B/oxoprolinase family protein, partial [Rhodospirillaceae bacterium]|nr:hydantoinase B/oxoprolinase family protein [Rhodospirillaceae bacterium]
RLEGEWKEDFPNAKVLTAHLKEGEAFRLRSGGGGGFGPAIERPAEKVAADVQQGYVTRKMAEQAYGVIVDSETLELDIAATEKLRATLG